MDSFLAKLSNEEKFTASEKKIAAYLINNGLHVLNMSAEQIGKATKTSGATVIRFAKKIGYSGLPNLKLDLASGTNENNFKNMDEIEQDDTVKGIYEKMGTRFKLIPDVIEERNPPKNIDLVVNSIESAKNIFVYGITASSLIAQDIQQKFTRIGLSVVFNPDFHQMVTTLQALSEPGDVSFCISDSGKTPEILLFQKISHELNLKTIGITSDNNSPLSKNSDLNLYSYKQVFSQVRSASTTGLMSQFYLIDILFYRYLSQNFDQGMANVLETRERIDKELRRVK
ncbi:MurR/RpiR family transcriptional regulator [Oenococcus alcoholitolerans]|uniref:RpiR family transcriptional regulator n=1 Tax=Oenococcus alcoholitolerans TaxID=931074 RepID=A0ABR4XPZ7_9LACO|nr:hypothetical protein Q757_06780 [Oenococcus alcoholitolerans]